MVNRHFSNRIRIRPGFAPYHVIRKIVFTNGIKLLANELKLFSFTMVKPLVFKGDKKPKKRKAPPSASVDADASDINITSHQIITQDATTNDTVDDDSWVSAEAPTDLAGPVLLVLSSTPPTCVACDQNGKVFASVVENIIEGEPATAEPHDKRQVWIATTVAGTDNFSFKGHHGR